MTKAKTADPIYKARASLAREYRGGSPDPRRIRELRGALSAAKVERVIRAEALVADPMTRADRKRLAKLLLEGGPGE